MAFINGPVCKIAEPLTPDKSLIRSGLLDSLALFNLALWIEERIGAPIDLSTLPLTDVWDTAAAIAAFITIERQNQAQ
jgi:acyl carrier protein